MHQDSTGKPIKVGSKVRFQGEHFTIKSFGEGGRLGVPTIEFEEEVTHTTEVPDEISVDRVSG